MKLFTINEPRPGDGQVVPGLRILPNESPMGLRWGGPTRDTCQVLTLCKAQYKAVRAMQEAKHIREDTVCHLVRADVIDTGSNELKIELERDEHDQRAFIYVCTQTLAAPPPSKMTYGAPDDAVRNTVTLTSNESVHVGTGRGPRDRVSRVFKPFSEAVGIERLGATLLTDEGVTWNEILLVLQPGASFRIVRGGDVRELVPEFSVTWNGHKLRTIVPERYRDRMRLLDEKREDRDERLAEDQAHQ